MVSGACCRCGIVQTLLLIGGIFAGGMLVLNIAFPVMISSDLADEKSFWQSTCNVTTVQRVSSTICSATLCNADINHCQVFQIDKYDATINQCVGPYIVGQVYPCWVNDLGAQGNICLQLRQSETTAKIIGLAVADGCWVSLFVLAGIIHLFQRLKCRGSTATPTTNPTLLSNNRV